MLSLRLSAWAFSTIVSGCASIAQDPLPLPALHPLEVAPRVYAVIGDLGPQTAENEGFNANVGFVVTSAGVIVIDSGPSERFAAALHAAIRRSTTQPVKLVINTNGQAHRWLGNAYFERLGVPIVAQRKALQQMRNDGGTQLEMTRALLRERSRSTALALPGDSFDARRIVRLGDMELQFLHFGPAHTPGDSMVWMPQSRVLFAGDIVYTERLLAVLPISSTKGWLEAFDRVAALAPEIIVPGHGAPATLARAETETRQYLVLLRNHAKRLLDAGATLADGPRRIDQTGFRHLENFEALAARNANQVFIEIERELFE